MALHQLATAVPVALAVTVKDPIVLFDDGVSTQVAPEVTVQRHMRPLLGLRVPLATRNGRIRCIHRSLEVETQHRRHL